MAYVKLFKRPPFSARSQITENPPTSITPLISTKIQDPNINVACKVSVHITAENPPYNCSNQHKCNSDLLRRFSDGKLTSKV